MKLSLYKNNSATSFTKTNLKLSLYLRTLSLYKKNSETTLSIRTILKLSRSIRTILKASVNKNNSEALAS